MILIWDNGCDYSDHEVYFIDCEGWSREETDQLVKVLEACTSGSAIGIGEIEWYDGYTRNPEDMFSIQPWFRYKPCAEHGKALRRLADSLLRVAGEAVERQRSIVERAAHGTHGFGQEHVDSAKREVEKIREFVGALGKICVESS